MPIASHACPGCQRVGMWKGPYCRTCKQLERMERDPITTPPSNPAWRPKHYPPACDACNGFGYIVNQSSDHPWSRCGSCRAHPGHSCSHSDWTALRA